MPERSVWLVSSESVGLATENIQSRSFVCADPDLLGRAMLSLDKEICSQPQTWTEHLLLSPWEQPKARQQSKTIKQTFQQGSQGLQGDKVEKVTRWKGEKVTRWQSDKLTRRYAVILRPGKSICYSPPERNLKLGNKANKKYIYLCMRRYPSKAWNKWVLWHYCALELLQTVLNSSEISQS